MYQKLPVDGFDWVEDTSKFNENFIKSYNEESDEEYFIEVDIEFPKNLCKIQNNLRFLFKRMKIGKFKKLVNNLHDKTEYVIHTKNLKQALNQG